MDMTRGLWLTTATAAAFFFLLLAVADPPLRLRLPGQTLFPRIGIRLDSPPNEQRNPVRFDTDIDKHQVVTWQANDNFAPSPPSYLVQHSFRVRGKTVEADGSSPQGIRQLLHSRAAGRMNMEGKGAENVSEGVEE